MEHMANWQSKKLGTVKEDRWLRYKLPIDKKEVKI